MADFTAVVTILIATIPILHFNISYNIMNDKRNVKRLLVFIACFVLTFGASRLNAAKVILNGNLSDYKYAYVESGLYAFDASANLYGFLRENLILLRIEFLREQMLLM